MFARPDAMPLPQYRVSSREEREECARRQAEVSARLERLLRVLEAERAIPLLAAEERS